MYQIQNKTEHIVPHTKHRTSVGEEPCLVSPWYYCSLLICCLLSACNQLWLQLYPAERDRRDLHRNSYRSKYPQPQPSLSLPSVVQQIRAQRITGSYTPWCLHRYPWIWISEAKKLGKMMSTSTSSICRVNICSHRHATINLLLNKNKSLLPQLISKPVSEQYRALHIILISKTG